MRNQPVESNDQYDALLSQAIEGEEQECEPLPATGKSTIAKEMRFRRSIEQLIEEKRLQAQISDYDFDEL